VRVTTVGRRIPGDKNTRSIDAEHRGWLWRGPAAAPSRSRVACLVCSALSGVGGGTLFPLVALASPLAAARMGGVVAKKGRDDMIKPGGGRAEISGEGKGVKMESRVDKKLRLEAEQVCIPPPS